MVASMGVGRALVPGGDHRRLRPLDLQRVPPAPARLLREALEHLTVDGAVVQLLADDRRQQQNRVERLHQGQGALGLLPRLLI